MLTGQSKRLSYAQDFCASVHLLSDSERAKEPNGVIAPSIDSVELKKLQPRVGTLLFFGIFFF
jgi:hypothetical protein